VVGLSLSFSSRWYPYGQRLLLALFLLGSSLAAPAAAQPDTTAVVRQDTADARSPSGALWRAAVLPGWGQWYNGQYLKIPVVYAALGGTIAGALYLNQRYLLYRHAYLYAARENPDGTPVFPEYEDDYDRLLRELGLPPDAALSDEEAQARQERLEPSLRRNRDLMYFGIGIVYGLSILDAYVSAHLLDFDVGEDLTLRVAPQPGGVAAVVRLNF
jgi:hypothetical protein